MGDPYKDVDLVRVWVKVDGETYLIPDDLAKGLKIEQDIYKELLQLCYEGKRHNPDVHKRIKEILNK